MARIQTTVVGSYPVPDWLVANPSEQALIDATRVVIDTQEQCGVDVVCDGELYRFDINHPETNGMIEYFVRPMDGITQRFSFDDLIAYRSKSGMKFRSRPPGTVIGPIGHGSLDLPFACARAKALATHTFKFTVTGPHMLAKTLIDKHYGDVSQVAHAIADVLAEQVIDELTPGRRVADV
jgi:5-methyltetrahydropteroyltriglutamate--homocysteine methyltransferase